MAKQKVYVLVGLPHSGAALLRLGMERHREALAAERVQLPAESEDEMFRAAVSLRREHRAWSLSHKDVDAAWSRIWRRAWGTKDTVVLGSDLLAGMSVEEIALMVDRFPGFAVHVVVLVGAPDPRVALFPDELDLTRVLHRWRSAVKSPDRVHVIAIDPKDPQPAWQSLGQVVGFGADALPLPEQPLAPGRLDPATVRLIADAAGAHASASDLRELSEAWAKLVADEGYDVRGELGSAAATSGATGEDAAAYDGARVAILSEALSESVAEVVRLRERVAYLDGRRTKSEKKRRKLKKRLKAT